MEDNAPQDEEAHQVLIDSEELQDKHLMTKCILENIWRNDKHCIDTAHRGKYESIKYLCIWSALIIQSRKVRYTLFCKEVQGEKATRKYKDLLDHHDLAALSCANSRWRSLENTLQDFFGSSRAAVSMMG